MSDFVWKLTPTERRIAEAAFGSVPNGKLRLRAHRASAAVLELRGSLDDVCCEHEQAMLAELRSEPGCPECSGLQYRAEMCLKAECEAVDARDRLRALLERVLEVTRDPPGGNLSMLRTEIREELAR